MPQLCKGGAQHQLLATPRPGGEDGGWGPVLPYLFLRIQCLVPFCAPYPTASTAWLMFSALQLVS